MPTRTFEQWVDCIFDHPVADSAWHWAEDADTCVEAADVNVDYLTRLFAQSGDILARFDDAQIRPRLRGSRTGSAVLQKGSGTPITGRRTAATRICLKASPSPP